MSFSYTTTLSLIEWLSLMGFAQCLLILVYIVSRARSFRQASLAIGYFFLLSLAFLLQFALRLEDFSDAIHFGLWLAWMSGPPLCHLLVVQISGTGGILPPARHFLTLLGVPAATALSMGASAGLRLCGGNALLCDKTFGALYCLGAIAGAVSLLSLWLSRDVFTALKSGKGGQERYWLAVALVIANIFVVGTALLRSGGHVGPEDADALLLVAGFAFVYLVTTALFRVYPLPVDLTGLPRGAPEMHPGDEALAEKVRALMDTDKLYQEPTFSRASLAQEVGVSEAVLSRVINTAFGKSFPQLLHAYRIEDAKILLCNPAIAIQTVASESGFNSLASFNRVFRDMTGETPSSFRARKGYKP